VLGAGLNVKINASGYDDSNYVSDILAKVASMEQQAKESEKEILQIVASRMS
jgi:formiminotetrahydrofolate cyclodeaminase